MAELIAGSSGQLGKELVKIYPHAVAVDRTELDISSQAAVENFNWQDIDAIFNAAAFTAVDAAETPEGKIIAYQANVEGVANLASVARQRDITLLHVSTDYVFDGTNKSPYQETDRVNPQNVYGQSKVESEKIAQRVPKHYIVRTSWVIGEGHNFVRTMLKLGAERKELEVVNDQIGRPTFAKDLAQAMAYLYEQSAPYGIYNFSNDGEPVSWADFARTIFDLANLDCIVKDTSTAAYMADKPPGAHRPAYSVMSLDKIKSTGLQVANWKDGLRAYIENETKK